MFEQQDKQRENIALHVCNRMGRLTRFHTTWKDLWREVADYVLPSEEDDIYDETTRGLKRENKLFDSTGVIATTELASALFSMVVDPSTKFFEFSTGRPEIDNQREVSIYLQQSAERLRRILSNSTFSNAIFETFIDLVAYGTGPFRIERDEEEKLRFTSVPIFQSIIDQDKHGNVDTIYREFRYTGKQLLEKFPNAFNDADRKELENTDTGREWKVIHAIEKREAFYGKEGAKGFLPYVNYYVLKEARYLLNDPLEGFKLFPFAIPRFYKTSYETYGRSPAMMALSDMKNVNVMKMTLLQGVQLMVAPPLQVPDNGLIRPIKFKPFSINYRRPGVDNKIEPLLLNPRVDVSIQTIQELRLQIEQAFFLDKLRVSDKTHQIQQQVFAQQDQSMKALGAVLARFHNELLKPTINIAFQELQDMGEMPEAPEILMDFPELEIRFTSQIARAQQLNEVQTLQQAIALMGPLIQLRPETADNINTDEATKVIFDSLGVNKRILNDQGTVSETREARAEAQQQEVQQQEAEGLVDSVAKLGIANT